MFLNRTIKTLAHGILIQTRDQRRIHRHCVNQNFIKDWFRSIKFYMDRKTSPPWKHCVQIGDPILRQVSTEIPIENIQEHIKDLEPLLKQMEIVLNDYTLVGIAAPQIGVPLRIFLMQFTEKQKKKYTSKIYQTREMQILPLTTVINPVIKVKNYDKKIFSEGCASVCGYIGDVARYYEIILSGYNENGDHFEMPLKGWNARIAQHELDHLNGQIFTDIMDRKTFSCRSWEAVNFHNGQLNIPFHPNK